MAHLLSLVFTFTCAGCVKFVDSWSAFKVKSQRLACNRMSTAVSYLLVVVRLRQQMLPHFPLPVMMRHGMVHLLQVPVFMMAGCFRRLLLLGTAALLLSRWSAAATAALPEDSWQHAMLACRKSSGLPAIAAVEAQGVYGQLLSCHSATDEGIVLRMLGAAALLDSPPLRQRSLMALALGPAESPPLRTPPPCCSHGAQGLLQQRVSLGTDLPSAAVKRQKLDTIETGGRLQTHRALHSGCFITELWDDHRVKGRELVCPEAMHARRHPALDFTAWLTFDDCLVDLMASYVRNWGPMSAPPPPPRSPLGCAVSPAAVDAFFSEFLQRPGSGTGAADAKKHPAGVPAADMPLSALASNGQGSGDVQAHDAGGSGIPDVVSLLLDAMTDWLEVAIADLDAVIADLERRGDSSLGTIILHSGMLFAGIHLAYKVCRCVACLASA